MPARKARAMLPMPDTDEVLAVERRAKVASLYTSGRNQMAIANELGIALSQVRVDLAWIHEQWLDRMMLDRDQFVAVELAKIDKLEQTAWEAWERSTQPRLEKSRQTRTHGIKGQKSVDEEVKEGGRSTMRDGNVAFLSQVERCIVMRIKLLGLNAPTQVDWEAEIRRWALERGYDPEQAVKIAQREARRMNMPASNVPTPLEGRARALEAKEDDES
jgi:hypothetical protein